MLLAGIFLALAPLDDYRNRFGRPLSLEELEQNPARAMDVLTFCLELSLSRENLRDPLWMERSLELRMDWIDARRPLTLKEAERLLDDLTGTDGLEEFDKIQHWAGKRGRPIKLRKAAIMALVRRHYLKKRWIEVTKRVCPCGEKHTTEKVLAECQPKLQVVVRILKRLLRDCKITLPETPRVF